MGITDYQLAKAIGVPQTRISAVTHGHRRITADTGLRLSRYLGMSEAFWTGLQEDHDREIANRMQNDSVISSAIGGGRHDGRVDSQRTRR